MLIRQVEAHDRMIDIAGSGARCLRDVARREEDKGKGRGMEARIGHRRDEASEHLARCLYSQHGVHIRRPSGDRRKGGSDVQWALVITTRLGEGDFGCKNERLLIRESHDPSGMEQKRTMYQAKHRLVHPGCDMHFINIPSWRSEHIRCI